MTKQEWQKKIEALREVLREDGTWGTLTGHPHPGFVSPPRGHSYRDAIERLLARLVAAAFGAEAPQDSKPARRTVLVNAYGSAPEDALSYDDSSMYDPQVEPMVRLSEALAVVEEVRGVSHPDDLDRIRGFTPYDAGWCQACNRITERLTALAGGGQGE